MFYILNVYFIFFSSSHFGCILLTLYTIYTILSVTFFPPLFCQPPPFCLPSFCPQHFVWYHFVIVPFCLVPFCHRTILSSYHFVIVPFCHRTILSSYHFVIVPFCPRRFDRATILSATICGHHLPPQFFRHHAFCHLCSPLKKVSLQSHH